MTQDLALRLTEVLLGLAFIQHSLEHMAGPRDERWLFGLRFLLSVWLISGVMSHLALLALLVNAFAVLWRFQGPYNGGSDKMTFLILFCLCIAAWLPPGPMRDVAFGYLAVQLVLSYFISGWVKVRRVEWRTGQALQDVFTISAYPVGENLRALARSPRLIRAGGWAVMVFELAFPVALFHQGALITALVPAVLFHLANACLFGLNRFFWIWPAAYPSLIWLQDRLL